MRPRECNPGRPNVLLLQVFEKDGLKQILDIHVYIALPPEQWSKILEQILLVVLILGR